MRKSRELIHLEHFKEAYPFFPCGDIEQTEKPDFIVHALHKDIGIEHTEMFQPGAPNGGSLQAQDSLALRVVEKASDLYRSNHSQSLLVQVLFNPRVEISKRDINRIAEAIVCLVDRTPVKPGNTIALKRTREDSVYFPTEIAHIYICRQNGKENVWFCSSSGFVPQITPKQIQEKINAKNQKLDSYKSRCSELWLLLVADYLRIPSMIDLTELAHTHHYVTRFDRVFFFWNSSRRYDEFQLVRDNNEA
jgi:hypothetical protein